MPRSLSFLALLLLVVPAAAGQVRVFPAENIYPPYTADPRSPEFALTLVHVQETFLLAEAGLLDGHEVTSHWALLPCFERYPNVRIAEGYPRVRSGNRVTGGGISSSIDEALGLVILIPGEDVAREVQLMTQYFPDPPITGDIPGATVCALPPVRRTEAAS